MMQYNEELALPEEVQEKWIEANDSNCEDCNSSYCDEIDAYDETNGRFMFDSSESSESYDSMTG